MPDLDQTIRDLAARGEISHISLTARHEGTKQIGWHASFSPAGTYGVTTAEGSDPIEVLIAALTSAKLKRRSPPHKPAKERDVETPAPQDDGLPDPTA